MNFSSSALYYVETEKQNLLSVLKMLDCGSLTSGEIGKSAQE